MNKNKKTIILIFLLTLFVRVFYVVAIPQLSLAGSDAKEYDLIAEGLLKGQGFPVEGLADNEVEIVRPPLFPLILAGIYKIFGHNYMLARIFQALLASIAVLFIYLLSIDIFRNKAAAVISCLIYSLYPSLIAYTGLLYSETVFIFLLVISMYFLNLSINSGKYKFYILTGLFLALATMISSRSLYMALLIFLGLLVVLKNKKMVFKGSFFIVLMMLVIFSPWTIRNYFVSGGEFILLENYSSETAIWLATNPQGEILEWSYDKEPLKSLVGNLPLSQRTPVIRKEAIKNFKKYPLAYLKNSFRRFFVLLIAGHSNCFSGFEKSMQENISKGEFFKVSVKAALLFLNVTVIFLGFIGMWLFRKEWAQSIAILIPVIYTIFLHTFYVAAPRLQMPMVPFLIIFAGFSIIKISGNFHKGNLKQGD